MGNLRDTLLQLVNNNEELYSLIGEVTAIDMDAMTCDVRPLNGSADVFGVRMSADPDHRGLHLIPKQGSICVITFLSKDTAYLSLISDLDQLMVDIEDTSLIINDEGIEIKRGNTAITATSSEIVIISGSEIKATGSGVLIKNGAESLRGILDDLITQITLMTVGTPAGPSTVPVNAAAFSLIKTRLSTLLTSN